MKGITMRTARWRWAAALSAALALAACGGGGSGETTTTPGGGTAGMPETPTTAGPAPGEATLLASGVHSRWTLSDGETEIAEAYAAPMSCTGARCTDGHGGTVTADGLREALGGSGADGTETGTRDGFRTAKATVSLSVAERVAEATVTARPSATGWGIWGDHGFAMLVTASGPLEARVNGTSYEGTLSQASAWASGRAAGTNPMGTGRAVWRGVAEAAETATFERLAGTATVTVPDLSRPRVDVAIDVPGHVIGAPGWTGIEISGGRFATGTAGTDRLAGDFHGPEHEEAWGAFDTGAYVGAFGARRTP